MKALTYKSIDVMKKTLDAVNGQLTTAEKTNLIACLASAGATHIAVEVPLDTNANFVTYGNSPSPRTVEAEIQDWYDVIHAQANLYGSSVYGGFLKVLNRGAFGGMNPTTNYGFPFRDFSGADGLPIGTAGSSVTDGETTWCGRLRRYILTNVGSKWQTGDVFAPIYEATSHAFDGHYWWDAGGSTAGFKNAFVAFHATADAAFATLGVTVAFQSHNNFSEVRSGWLDTGLFTDQNFVGFDFYGNDNGGGSKVSDYLRDLNTTYTNKAKPMGFGEWGDIAGQAIPSNESNNIYNRMFFLINFYTMLRDNFVDSGKLTTFNYWGGWEGQNTSILKKTGSGASSVYSLNARGKILAAFYLNQGGMNRVPVITSGNSDDTYNF